MWEMLYDDVCLSHCIPHSVSLTLYSVFSRCLLLSVYCSLSGTTTGPAGLKALSQMLSQNSTLEGLQYVSLIVVS